MIKKILKDEFNPFFNLMGEVELGSKYNPSNEEHKIWLEKKITSHFSRGVEFIALYEANDKPLGFAALMIEKGPKDIPYLSHKAELYDIAIFPEFRGKGFGKILLDNVEKNAREEKMYCLYMSTYANDEKVINFYEKNGYTLVATLPDVHGPNDEGVVYLRKVL